MHRLPLCSIHFLIKAAEESDAVASLTDSSAADENSGKLFGKM